MEIWTPRNTFTYSGMELKIDFPSMLLILILTRSNFILQAAYFVRNGFRRRDKRSNMLLVIFDLYLVD